MIEGEKEESDNDAHLEERDSSFFDRSPEGNSQYGKRESEKH